jgi:hypothetical protein
MANIGRPTRYWTRLAGGPLIRVATIRRTTDTFLFISHTTNIPLFKFRCTIFSGVRIIKEMPGSVASGTPFIIPQCEITLHGETSPKWHIFRFINGKKCNLEFHAANTNAWDNNISHKEHTKPPTQLIPPYPPQLITQFTILTVTYISQFTILTVTYITQFTILTVTYITQFTILTVTYITQFTNLTVTYITQLLADPFKSICLKQWHRYEATIVFNMAWILRILQFSLLFSDFSRK